MKGINEKECMTPERGNRKNKIKSKTENSRDEGAISELQ